MARLLKTLAWTRYQIIMEALQHGLQNLRGFKEKSLNFGMLAMCHWFTGPTSFCYLRVIQKIIYTWRWNTEDCPSLRMYFPMAIKRWKMDESIPLLQGIDAYSIQLQDHSSFWYIGDTLLIQNNLIISTNICCKQREGSTS